eukprot:CAMPEP_0170600184 /NCGR_PEP_ID=MMETSP0224-20130122/17202_1 /TAXON_ID=285029 /ORGANISM="Togula jolla, Strain CCCM 725" /LENGTH=558 /DNA_ID=CAMNT_0010924899 /DNA_START=27 /DNA_END=1700 /DNA_ORIENTATION=-
MLRFCRLTPRALSTVFGLLTLVQPGRGIAGVKLSTLQFQKTVERVTLRNNFDVEYTAEITVGGEKLNAVLDTGSFDVVILSTECDYSCGDVGLLYNEQRSSTFQSGNITAEQFYGSGSTKSRECWDTMDAGFGPVEHQVFWKVYSASMALLQDSSFQAIVGLGPPQSSIEFARSDLEQAREMMSVKQIGNGDSAEGQDIVANYEAILQHAEEAESLAQNFNLEAFSICLGKELGSAGYFIWHDTLPQSQPQGMFKTVPAEDDLYWTTTLSDVSLGALPSSKLGKSTPLGCHSGTKCNAIFDTGTSLIMVPSSAMSQVQTALNSWRDISGDCTKLSQLPNLEFTIGGEKITLPPDAYVGEVYGDLRQVDPELQRFMPHLKALVERRSGNLRAMANATEADSVAEDEDVFDDYSWDDWDFSGFGDNCVPLLMVLDLDSHLGQSWLFGIPFFRKYYTTFKFKQDATAKPPVTPESISFAEKDEDCRPKAAAEENFLPVSSEDGLVSGWMPRSSVYLGGSSTALPEAPRATSISHFIFGLVQPSAVAPTWFRVSPVHTDAAS